MFLSRSKIIHSILSLLLVLFLSLYSNNYFTIDFILSHSICDCKHSHSSQSQKSSNIEDEHFQKNRIIAITQGIEKVPTCHIVKDKTKSHICSKKKPASYNYTTILFQLQQLIIKSNTVFILPKLKFICMNSTTMQDTGISRYTSIFHPPEV